MTTIASVAERGQKNLLSSGCFAAILNWSTSSNWRFAYPPAKKPPTATFLKDNGAFEVLKSQNNPIILWISNFKTREVLANPANGVLPYANIAIELKHRGWWYKGENL